MVEKSRHTHKARTILRFAMEAKVSLMGYFDAKRTARRATGGMTTHAEQDLLRAMLVFVAGGLDSLMKHLIKDTLAQLTKLDSAVLKGLESFTNKKLRGGGEASDVVGGRRFLAQILASPAPQQELIDAYVQELTGGSLQSTEQLCKAIAALGLKPYEVGIDPQILKPIFEARNQIIHELDVNFNSPRRKRRARGRYDMLEYSEVLLKTGKSIIENVEAKLISST
jgi:hypothetical protein